MLPRWCLAEAEALSWRAWDDEIVLYDDASGDTHHFAPLAAEIFEQLYEKPAAVDELARRISYASGLTLDDELTQSIAATIKRFYAYGLIKPMAEEKILS